MTRLGILHLAVSLAAALLAVWIHFWLGFCYGPAPFHVPDLPADCHLAGTTPPHAGLVFGFITAVAVASLSLLSALGFFASRSWAPRCASVVSLGGAVSFLGLGLVSSGLRLPCLVAAAVLVAAAGIVRHSSRPVLDSPARRRG